MRFGNDMGRELPTDGQKPFWTCWVQGLDGGYGFEHPTPESAMKEAERLAETSGRKVFVLQLVGVCRIDVIRQSTWTQPAESPIPPTELPF